MILIIFFLWVNTVLSLNAGTPGPKVMELFSCSTQLSMKFVLLISLKLLTTAFFFFFLLNMLNIAEHENFSANKF